jgi:hypothetical protein
MMEDAHDCGEEQPVLIIATVISESSRDIYDESLYPKQTEGY